MCPGPQPRWKNLVRSWVQGLKIHPLSGIWTLYLKKYILIGHFWINKNRKILDHSVRKNILVGKQWILFFSVYYVCRQGQVFTPVGLFCCCFSRITQKLNRFPWILDGRWVLTQNFQFRFKVQDDWIKEIQTNKSVFFPGSDLQSWELNSHLGLAAKASQSLNFSSWMFLLHWCLLENFNLDIGK